MKPRIEQLPGGLTREAIAEQIHIIYDPRTLAASVSFQHRDSLYVDGQFLAVSGDWSTIVRQFDDIASRTLAEGITDPVTGVDLSHVSCAGVMAIIKAAYASLYDEAARPAKEGTP